jgi:signal peptidase
MATIPRTGSPSRRRSAAPSAVAATTVQPGATVLERLLGVARRVVDGVLLVVIAIGLSTALLGRVLPALGHPVLIVAGPSMEPAIPIGSAVVLTSVEPDALRVGDIASLRTGPSQAIFTHRITRVAERDGATWIETMGDANAAVDPSLTPADAVIGRVTVTVPVAGYLLTLLSSPIGLVFALSLGGLLLVMSWLLDDLGAARRRRRRVAARPIVRGRQRMAGRPPASAR